ncbi:MAG: HD domain-containing protein [Lachnospiraceae bacterium]
MRFDFTDILFAFSYGLDCVEQEAVGVSKHHSKRVAYMVSRLAKRLQMDRTQRIELAGCALLHDNALSEYFREEFSEKGKNLYELHCAKGERNMSMVPFQTNIKGIILYHHEHADGTGTFHKKASETPLGAQLIHLADIVDVKFNLKEFPSKKWAQIKAYLRENRDKKFSGNCIELFLDEFNQEKIEKLTEEHLSESLQEEFPENMQDYKESQVKGIAGMFAQIIDYKSESTNYHSMGVAEKAEKMARYYGYEEEKVLKCYFAGALHDIGKLIVDSDILEKPDKLTEKEYSDIQNHAQGTYDILNQISGMEDIRDWASLHHEKLNGTGYPFGKTGEELGEEERLMACIDIYQALTELRPYKKGLSHQETMNIMKSMVRDGLIDGRIVSDLDHVFHLEQAGGVA